MRRLNAKIIFDGQDYYMHKTCPEHGKMSTVIWRGTDPDMRTWGHAPIIPDDDTPCPTGCAECTGHLQNTCCVLVEITNRCDLNCRFCFARGGDVVENEPTVDELYGIFCDLVKSGKTFVQLSGGEPCVRDDLPEIIAAAKKAGCETVQLNSNGLRIAQEPEFAKALADAGLSFVFLQFDGTNDDIYTALRGRELFELKKQTISVCGKLNVGVTLVPTVVRGVNDGNIGDIVNFAIENSPAVRGVHFQPVSFFGRYPKAPEDGDRITLPEVLRAIEQQTGGRIKMSDIAPSKCDHPRCGFHGDFIVMPDGILALTPKDTTTSCCCKSVDTDAALKNRRFVARRWTRPEQPQQTKGELDMTDMDTFISRGRTHAFTITAMAFQDRYNLDIERLRVCSLHVWHNGKAIPFCARYISAQ
jgi:hypothetical protein